MKSERIKELMGLNSGVFYYTNDLIQRYHLQTKLNTLVVNILRNEDTKDRCGEKYTTFCHNVQTVVRTIFTDMAKRGVISDKLYKLICEKENLNLSAPDLARWFLAKMTEMDYILEPKDLPDFKLNFREDKEEPRLQWISHSICDLLGWYRNFLLRNQSSYKIIRITTVKQ